MAAINQKYEQPLSFRSEHEEYEQVLLKKGRQNQIISHGKTGGLKLIWKSLHMTWQDRIWTESFFVFRFFVIAWWEDINQQSLHCLSECFKYRYRPMIYIYRLDVGVIGSCMGFFRIVGHWPKILSQNSKGASLICVLCMCIVYCV